MFPKIISDKRFLSAGAVSLCILLLLCFCVPAQNQTLKIPFLCLSCFFGLCIIIDSKGRAISKPVWFLLIAYIAYNLIWSVMGLVNKHSGAGGYFRLGVIWPIAFVLIIALIGRLGVKWISATLWVILGIQTLAVLLLVGYALQLWPNLLTVIYPASRVGIHNGYLHVVGHFVGGLCFSFPYVYSRIILNDRAKWWQQVLTSAFMFVVIFAIVATSRRILLIVVLACGIATVMIPIIQKPINKTILLRSIIGLVLLLVFIAANTSLVSKISSEFLSSHYYEITDYRKGQYQLGSGSLKYTDGLVFNLDGVRPMTDDQLTSPDVSAPDNTPSDGYVDRVEGMITDLEEGSVRNKIINSVFSNWYKRPIFGVGFGAQLPGYPTSPDSIYEMEYVVRLYTSGIVGILCLLVIMVYVGIAPLHLIRKRPGNAKYLGPITVAYFGAVVATISNPYIFSGFDYLFMLFLPVAVLNHYLSNSKDSDYVKREDPVQ